jgi:ubiquitin C-terminal hydrolase
MQAKLIESKQLPTSASNLAYNPSKKRESLQILDEDELKSDSTNGESIIEKSENSTTTNTRNEMNTNEQAEKPAAKRLKYSIFPNLNEKLLTKMKKEPKNVSNKTSNQASETGLVSRKTSQSIFFQKKNEPNFCNKTMSNENNSNSQQQTFACLRNLGSTCYINCIIQVMRYTPGFVLSIHRLNKQIEHLKSLNISELDSELTKNNDVMFVRNLHELLAEMSDKERLDRRPIYTPRKFVNTVWQSLGFWSDGSQQDAHEFLQYTIHFINECDFLIRKLQQKYQIKLSSLTMNMSAIKISSNQAQNANLFDKTSFDENVLFKSKSQPDFSSDNQLNSVNQLSKSIASKLLKSETSVSLTSNVSNSFRRTPTKGGANSHSLNKKELAEICEEESMFQKSSEIDEKDLVSRRLKETLLRSPVVVKQHLKPNCNLSNKTYQTNLTMKTKQEEINSRKKLKRDEVLAQQMKMDSDSFIIIMDSDEDESIYLDLVEPKPTLLLEQLNQEFPSEIKDKNANQKENESPQRDSFVITKKCHVMIENFNMDDLLIKNHVTLYQPKEEQKMWSQISESNLQTVRTQTKSQKKNSNIISNESKTSTRSATNRLRSKAKTFPPSEIQQTNMINPNSLSEISTKSIEDIDAITLIESVKFASDSNVLVNANSSRTPKSTSSRKMSPIKSANANYSNQVEMNNAQTAKNSSAVSSPAPPSPAELLRKHLTGYTCEMDTLFKGSSITVTQCLECENLRTCPESFYDRSIPIDTNGDDDESNWISKCLHNESYLDGDSKYMCETCKTKQIAKIHTQYTQMPKILVLHLLSYGITSNVNGNLNAQKINNRSRLVSYFDFVCTKPKSLRSTQLLNSPKTSHTKFSVEPQANQHQENSSALDQFKLFAVVMHSGVSLNSGHYTAYINYKIILEHQISNSQKSRCQNNDSKLNEICSCHQMETISNNSDCNSNDSFNSSTTATNSSQNSLNNSPEWLHFDDTKVKMLSNNEFHRKVVDSKFDSPYILFYVKD